MDDLSDGFLLSLSEPNREELARVFAQLEKAKKEKQQALKASMEALVADREEIQALWQAERVQWEEEKERLLKTSDALRAEAEEKHVKSVNGAMFHLNSIAADIEEERVKIADLERQKARLQLQLDSDGELEGRFQHLVPTPEQEAEEAARWRKRLEEVEMATLSKLLATIVLKLKVQKKLQKQGAAAAAKDTVDKAHGNSLAEHMYISLTREGKHRGQMVRLVESSRKKQHRLVDLFQKSADKQLEMVEKELQRLHKAEILEKEKREKERKEQAKKQEEEGEKETKEEEEKVRAGKKANSARSSRSLRGFFSWFKRK